MWGLETFEGSLSSLQHVSNLAIGFDTRWRFRSSSTNPLSSLLPINSANCLTRLRIHIPEIKGLQLDPTGNPFDNFVNLKDLEIHESDPKIFELIAAAQISIVSLTVERVFVSHIVNVQSHKVEEALLLLLSAPCVKEPGPLSWPAKHFQLRLLTCVDRDSLRIPRGSGSRFPPRKHFGLWF